jgi:putative holliday junction resolvase
MRWLCLDPGEKRTGVAVSSPEGTFAIPLVVLEHDPDGPVPGLVRGLMEEHRADGLVIGLPLNMDGTMSSRTVAVVRFARGIAANFGVTLETPDGLSMPEGDEGLADDPVSGAGGTAPRIVLWDERLTSWEAQRMRDRGEPERRRKGAKKRPLDAHAAAVILQSYLDAQPQQGGKTHTCDSSEGFAD